MWLGSGLLGWMAHLGVNHVIRNIGFNKIFKFTTIGILKDTKAPNIKRLSKIRKVYRKV